MSLVRETRWSRTYKNSTSTVQFVDSRFLDGTAAIGLDELVRDWDRWSRDEQLDFGQSLNCCQSPERADILRYLMRLGSHRLWSSIAALIATDLPPEETLPFLRDCCTKCAVGEGANYFQALWLTKCPDAIEVLHSCLERIWSSPNLMKPDRFCNFAAFDAIWCIDALVRLGQDPESLRDRYEALKSHPTSGAYATKWLSEHFE